LYIYNEKFFVEGLDLETKDKITEISYYYKLKNERDINNFDESHIEFRIIRSWEKVVQINKWKEIPKIEFCNCVNSFYKKTKPQAQRYEFVLLREDIVTQSKQEFNINIAMELLKIDFFILMIYN